MAEQKYAQALHTTSRVWSYGMMGTCDDTRWLNRLWSRLRRLRAHEVCTGKVKIARPESHVELRCVVRDVDQPFNVLSRYIRLSPISRRGQHQMNARTSRHGDVDRRVRT
jgi:hypothetical protein